MNEHKKIIDLRQVLYGVHSIVFLLTMVMILQLLWAKKGVQNFGLAVATGSIFFVLFFMELIFNYSYKKKQKERGKVFSYLPKILQLIATYLFFLAFLKEYRYGIDLLFFMIFSIEMIYIIDFSEQINRIACYFFIFAPYEIMSTVIIVKTKGLKFEDHFRFIVRDVIVMLLIILVIEALAKIWNYFESCILKQHRVLDRLNDSNEELKEHQEKVKKINEMLGIQKIQLQAANKRINVAHNEMMVQNAIGNTISTSLELRVLLTSLCELMLKKLKVDFVGFIVKTNAERRANENVATQVATYISSFDEDFDIMLTESFASSALKTILEIDKVYMEDSKNPGQFLGAGEAHYMNSLIIVPLINNGEKVGNMVVGSIAEYAFADNREFYETIAGQISMGVSSAILYLKMKEMAIRDGLTGIYNRRHLTETVDKHVKEAMKSGKSVSLALFDIDKFKLINDTYGHLFGDKVIRYVAKLLNNKAGENGGYAGRYGGEEFVLVFPDKTLDETYELIRQVHDEIKSEALMNEDDEVHVRVSSGISSFPETCKNPNEILTRADWAMYHSKRNGRDQITVDSENVSAKM